MSAWLRMGAGLDVVSAIDLTSNVTSNAGIDCSRFAFCTSFRRRSRPILPEKGIAHVA
jgi:hypothetical protein